MILFLVFLFIICYYNISIFKNKKLKKTLKVYISHRIYVNYMELQNLIFIIIAILAAVLLLKVFMWLLPVIVVLLIAFFIYMFLKQRY